MVSGRIKPIPAPMSACKIRGDKTAPILKNVCPILMKSVLFSGSVSDRAAGVVPSTMENPSPRTKMLAPIIRALPESAARIQPAISRQPNRDTAFFLLIRSVRPPNSSVERMVAADCTDAKIPICVPVMANP